MIHFSSAPQNFFVKFFLSNYAVKYTVIVLSNYVVKYTVIFLSIYAKKIIVYFAA